MNTEQPDIQSTDQAKNFETKGLQVKESTGDELIKRTATLEKDLEEAKNNFEKNKFDLITLLGVFVGLITYLGLEIQVFKAITNPLLIIGISIFFIASILLFVLTINIILKNQGTILWEDTLKNPLYVILIVLFAISIGCIAYCDRTKPNDQQLLFSKEYMVHTR